MALCSPLIAAGGLADLGYQEEVCTGDFPVVPALKTFRRRSTTLTLTKDSYNSEETRADRMVADSRHGIRRSGGDIIVELSPGSHADAWEAELGGIWQSPANISMTTHNVVISQHPLFPTDPLQARMVISGTSYAAHDIRPGDTITFLSTGDADLNGTRITITSIESDGSATARLQLGAVPVLPKTVNAGSLVYMGARVEMGSIGRSYIFERAFTDIGSFITYRGQKFNSAAVDLPATGIATATFGLLGKTADPISGASFDGVAEIVLTQATLTSLTFNATTGTIVAGAGDFDDLAPGNRVIFDGPGLDAMPQNKNPRTITEVNGASITVAEAIQSGTTSGGGFTVTRVGLPDYEDAPTFPVLVAVNGILMVDDEAAGTVTAASFTIDNGMAGPEVVGSNVIPAMLFGNQCSITGSLTVLFDRGGIGAKIYNAFDAEIDISLLLRMDDNLGGFLQFFFPRVKVNAGSIGDAVAEGLPVSVDFSAVKPHPVSGHTGQIIVQDSTVIGVPPIDLSDKTIVTGKGLTFTMEGIGSATPTITVSGTANANGTATVTSKVNGLPAESDPAAFTSAQAASAVATTLATTLNGQADIVAAVDGAVSTRVNISLANGAYVESLLVVIT